MMRYLLFGLLCWFHLQLSWAVCTDDSSTQPCTDSFTYRVRNTVARPYFSGQAPLKVVDGKPLMYYMETAPKRTSFNSFARFTITYYEEYSGYFVNSINGLEGGSVNGTYRYWRISNSTAPLDVGISDYIPTAGEVITFDYVTYSH